MKKKILFLDSIDKGYRNFLRLNERLIEKGFETLFVHTNSLYENNTLKETCIENLHSRDISYYNTKFIRRVIEIEKPNIILILNLSFIYDRAIINIAKQKNIKTVYLAHGSLITPSTYNSARTNLDKEIKNNKKRIFRTKNFWVLLNYIDSQKGLKKFTSVYSLLKGIKKHPAEYLTMAKYTSELDADLMLVYEKKDKVHLVENMRFPEKKISVVGNPEISTFMQSAIIDKNMFLSKIDVGLKENYGVYLDDGLVSNKRWTKEEWYEHLISVINIVKSANKKLLLKLHPRTNINEHAKFFKKFSDILYPLLDVDFKNLLFYADFVISHYSSTVVYALLFNKNVFIPKWSENSKKLTNKYPATVVTYCYELSDLERGINDCSNSNEQMKSIEEYLKDIGVNSKINSIDLIIEKIGLL